MVMYIHTAISQTNQGFLLRFFVYELLTDTHKELQPDLKPWLITNHPKLLQPLGFVIQNQALYLYLLKPVCFNTETIQRKIVI
jgi:hypothetical protein